MVGFNAGWKCQPIVSSAKSMEMMVDDVKYAINAIANAASEIDVCVGCGLLCAMFVLSCL